MANRFCFFFFFTSQIYFRVAKILPVGAVLIYTEKISKSNSQMPINQCLLLIFMINMDIIEKFTLDSHWNQAWSVWSKFYEPVCFGMHTFIIMYYSFVTSWWWYLECDSEINFVNRNFRSRRVSTATCAHTHTHIVQSKPNPTHHN